MSHFAKVVNGIVTEVIVAELDFIQTLPDANLWFQTSYNTKGGIHYDQNGNPDGGIALRANYASIGYTYDHQNDVFYPPRPLDWNNVSCASWTISAPDWTWKPPVEMPPVEIPTDPLAEGEYYVWDEASRNWIVK